MINIDTLRSKVQWLVNNVQQGRLKSALFNIAVNNAQDEYFRYLIGIPQQYNENQQSKPAQSRAVQHALAPFISQANLSVTAGTFYDAASPTGFPSDYQQFIALYAKVSVKKNTADDDSCACSGVLVGDDGAYNVYQIPVKHIRSDQWAKRINSTIVKPNKFKPIFKILGTGGSVIFQILPGNLGNVTMDYYKTPQRGNWAATVQNGVEVYDAVNSVNLEWDNMLLDEIANRVADYYLGNVKDLNGQKVVREKKAVGV